MSPLAVRDASCIVPNKSHKLRRNEARSPGALCRHTPFPGSPLEVGPQTQRSTTNQDTRVHCVSWCVWSAHRSRLLQTTLDCIQAVAAAERAVHREQVQPLGRAGAITLSGYRERATEIALDMWGVQLEGHSGAMLTSLRLSGLRQNISVHMCSAPCGREGPAQVNHATCQEQGVTKHCMCRTKIHHSKCVQPMV